MKRGDDTEVKARQGSFGGRRAPRGPEVGQGGPGGGEGASGCAAQAFGGEGRMGRNVGKEAENRTVERLGGTARGPGPCPSHLTWHTVGVQV